MRHTPTPWKIAETGDAVFSAGTFTICSADRTRSICDIVGLSPGDMLNGEDIIRACNAHEELVASLNTCRQFVNDIIEGEWDFDCNGPTYPEGVLERIRAALAKAEGR